MNRNYATTSLGQIHFVRTGIGPPLVLLAAAGRSSHMFTALLPKLADSFDVIALDTPGFGNSDPLPGGTTIEQIAYAFIEVLDQMGIDRAAVYGLHTGNKIATAMAVQNRERITKLILAGQSHSLILDQETRNSGIRQSVSKYVNFDGGKTKDDGKKIAAKNAEDIAAQIIELLNQAASNSGTHPIFGGHIFAHVLDKMQGNGIADLYLANFNYDLQRGFSQIRVPTLVLEIATAQETEYVGLQGKEVVRLIEGSTLCTMDVPDGRGLTLEDRPDELATIIKMFLR